MADFWDQWAQELAHPHTDNGTEAEVITPPQVITRASGAVSRLVTLLRDPEAHRFTAVDLRDRCGIQKANLARTLRTATVKAVMEAEGWQRRGGYRGFELVRLGASPAPPPTDVSTNAWDF